MTVATPLPAIGTIHDAPSARDLEDLVTRLQDENDRMAQAAAVAILELQSDELKEMQPV